MRPRRDADTFRKRREVKSEDVKRLRFADGEIEIDQDIIKRRSFNESRTFSDDIKKIVFIEPGIIPDEDEQKTAVKNNTTDDDKQEVSKRISFAVPEDKKSDEFDFDTLNRRRIVPDVRRRSFIGRVGGSLSRSSSLRRPMDKNKRKSLQRTWSNRHSASDATISVVRRRSTIVRAFGRKTKSIFKFPVGRIYITENTLLRRMDTHSRETIFELSVFMSLSFANFCKY